ncbi:type I polyketide synthase [Kitasatospora sp. NPDC018058]|uniref:type I polyketide synthase n=1 Tax=Kitasatospora sp. NPDC018058 TaxID=3364025 RepID=UPI0037BF9BD6
MSAVGQIPAEHPLLGAVVVSPESGGVVLTGRLSVETQPWLADHAVFGTELLPGTAFVELALRAALEVDCTTVEELTLEAPLALPERGGTAVQVVVGAPEESGTRTVAVYSRPEKSPADLPWTRHATGVLAPHRPTPSTGPAEWPPSDAVAVEVEAGGVYERLAARGYRYGPVFRGLRALWRRGQEVLAEVELPPGQAANAVAFGVHPALLDAALHALPFTTDLFAEGEVLLPFSWNGVTVPAPGASTLRVRLTPVGAGTVSLEATDASGAVVVSVASLVLRPVDAAQLRAAAGVVEADTWRYEVAWERVPGTATGASLSGTWLAVVPAGLSGAAGDGSVDGYLAALAAGGAEVVRLDVSAADAEREALASMLAGAQEGCSPFSGVVSLLGLDGNAHPLAPGVPAGVAGSLLLLQALGDAGVQAPLWCLTRGAVSTDVADPVTEAGQAMLWGLGRVAALEHPERWGGLIDLPTGTDSRSAELLVGVLAGPGGEDQLALRPQGVFRRRLVRAAAPAGDGGRPPRGAVLITGGTGGLGVHVARWAAGCGAEDVVLLSRRGAEADGVAALREELEARGTRLRVVAADVTDRESLTSVLAELRAEDLAVTTVVHAAGVADECPLDDLRLADLTRVVAVKAVGARLLEELLDEPAQSEGAGLEAFVVFSSIAGVWGSGRLAAYAAANAYLDAFVQQRRSRGLAGTALAWGPWAGGGMVDATYEHQLRRRGLTPMDPEAAVHHLGRSLAADDTATVIADVDWTAFHPSFTIARKSRLFDTLPQVRRARPHRPAADGDPADRARDTASLAGATEAEQEASLLDLVRREVASVLGHAGPEAVDPGRAFNAAGVDSLMAVELRNRLVRALDVALPATLVFDHPNPSALAGHLRAELFGAEQRASADGEAPTSDEPLAIVGMACRLPGGVTSPEDLWTLVSEGRDAVSGFPTDRGWDLDGLYHPDRDHTGTSYTRHGGFLHRAADFDPAFFGIAPREAAAMDPQQRLLLETSWEAFESAGLTAESVRGSRTGVFAGSMYHDYASRLGQVPDGFQGLLGIGTTGSVVSGRISYTFGLEGPAVTVDTACSSSLVALHLAGQALRQGECDLALAGGVTVMATPFTFTEFSRQGALSADGRCKAFSADADGTGWAEGVGVLVLERLSDAQRLGHEVLAVIRGSAVNQDGASNGLTAPNGPAQQRVITSALANARVSAREVDVVEAHGTGTRLGDPIEAQALIAVYGQHRSAEQPLWLGSLKSNIGHAQAAAGVGGVIKMVQAMRHGVLPKTLHVDRPTPEVDWSAGTVRLLTEERPWPETGHPRRAGISSFGISGTNAHVILEQAPDRAVEPQPSDPATPAAEAAPWLLSAHSPEALRAQAARLHDWVNDHPEQRPADIALSLATTRSLFDHRAAVTADDRDSYLRTLNALARGETAPDVFTGAVTPAAASRVVLMFPGQGSQWPGMAVELLDTNEVFAAHMHACEQALTPWVDWSLDDVVRGRVPDELAQRVDVVQPVLFAVMVSLAQLWRSWGLKPAAVLGHSQGEIAAACVAGALTLHDAARLIAIRSRLLRDLAGTGHMLSVVLSADEARARLADWPTLSLAADNGAGSVVVSGPDEALDAFAADCARDTVRTRRVDVDYASHSAEVESVRDRLLAELADLAPQSGSVPVYSTVLGRRVDGTELDAAYWYRNLRDTVRLRDTVETLADDGHGCFLETSPHPVLAVGVRQTLDAQDHPDTPVLGSLRRDHGGLRQMLTAAAHAHVHGIELHWPTILQHHHAHRVHLPTYAFQHQRYWLEPTNTTTTDTTDTRFWEAVHNQDLSALATTLQLPDGPARDGLAHALPALADWHRQENERSLLNTWRYRITWNAAPEPHRPTTPTGSWLILTAAGGAEWAAAASSALTAHGEHVRLLELTGGDADRAVLADRVKAALAEDGPGCTGVLSLLALAEAPHEGLPALPEGLALNLAAVQALGDAGIDAPLWMVTTQAVSVSTTERLASPAQAQCWGLGRVAALEHPDRWGGLVDVPAVPDPRTAARLTGVLVRGGDEDQWTLRASGSYVPRLVRHARQPSRAVRDWKPRDTVLITGATGSLGPHLARWIAARGAGHIVLASRRGPASPGIADLQAELAALGTPSSAEACDVADRADVARLVARLRAAGHTVRTVLHAAAHLALGSLAETTPEEFARIVHAKAAGAVHLGELLDPDELEDFVLFSSIASVWGSGEHAAYAAANAFLDAFAQQRRADGLPATSVAWGIWDERTTVDRTDATRVVLRGLPFIEPARAFRALEQVLDDEETFLAVADVDWANFLPVFTSMRPSPLISEVPEVRALLDEAAHGSRESDERGAELRQRIAGLPEGEREGAVLQLVTSHVAAVLGHGSADPDDAGRAFRDFGFDSLMSVDLRNRLSTATGLVLPPTLVFDHATPVALAQHLHHELLGLRPDTAESVIEDLDRLESAIVALADDTARLRLATRLGAVLRRIEHPQEYGGDPTAVTSLEDASVEELLDFLDNDLDSRLGEP